MSNVPAGEVHQRVRNHLQLISTLLSLQARSAPDPCNGADALRRAQRRVQAVALIQEVLLSGEQEAWLHPHALLAALGRRAGLHREPTGALEIHVSSTGPPIPAGEATAVGLLLHELVDNVVRHGASGETPLLVLEARVERGRRILNVRDSGPGLPPGVDPRTARTFGFTLVRLLTEQLRGALRVEPCEGLSIGITYPLGGAP